MLSISDLTPVIESELRSRLGRFGFYEVKVSAGRDHDGDPVIIADARYKQGAPMLDSREKSSAITEIMRYMIDKGDDRFLWLRNHFDGDDIAEDKAEEPRR